MQTQADYLLDYDVVSVAEEQRIFLLARIRADADEALMKRRPLNLSVVLDRSGSMAGDKLEYVKKAAQFLVQHLGTQDRFSVVSYDDTVKVEHKAGPVSNKDQIKNTIANIRSGGMTNLSGGWLQGCQLVVEGQEDGQINRVILLSDGLANQGITDPGRLASMASQKRAEGVTTTTMGVGMGFNEDLMTKMAHEGGGAFYFIDHPDQAPGIFKEELEDLLSVVGQNLKVALTLSDQVQMMRQLNTYPSTREGGAYVFQLGDLYADEEKSLLVELQIPALQSLGEVEIAHLRFEYDELTEDKAEHRVIEIPIMVNAVAADDASDRKTNEEVKRNALLLEAVHAREEAMRQADRGEFEAAKASLSQVADAIEQADLDDDTLRREHDMLREEAVDMEFGSQRYNDYSRKMTSTKVSAGLYKSSMGHVAQTTSSHYRMRSSRPSIEREGDTPAVMTWRKESMALDGVDEIRIGRGEDNDIVLDDEEVSEVHCIIKRVGDDLLLEDLDSTNGTFANSGTVSGMFRLSVGDVVSVGTTLFRFKGADA